MCAKSPFFVEERGVMIPQEENLVGAVGEVRTLLTSPCLSAAALKELRVESPLERVERGMALLVKLLNIFEFEGEKA